ncbi:DUF4238 domain-containing protein [Xanthomonas campestris]|uniref:DUF4238 domain-containing protein n=1 Tax=Xanthomonas campestris TaxID=339 RepID=UPI0032E4EF37
MLDSPVGPRLEHLLLDAKLGCVARLGLCAGSLTAKRKCLIDMSITKKQHHVWKDYFDPWLVDGRIALIMDGKVISTGPGNVAHQRYFYEIGEMTERDIAILRSLTSGQQSEVIRTAAEFWIDSVQLIFKLRDEMVARGLDRTSLEEVVIQASRQLGEQYQGITEHSGLKYLPTLRNSDTFNIKEGENYVEFCFFVMAQYFRTLRAKESLRRQMDADNPGYVDRSMAAIIPIMTTLVGASLVNMRDRLVPTLLLNKSGVKFITGDQPIINTHAVYVPKGENIPETEFYYPISPDRAIIFSENLHYRSGVITDPAITREFNKKMALSAERSAFASCQSELHEWKDVVGKHRHAEAN